MKSFARLYERLDASSATTTKVATLVEWFGAAPAADAAWAVWFLTGRRRHRLVPSRALRQLVQRRTDLPDWLVEDAYASVGDLAETVALLLDAHAESIVDPRPPAVDRSLADWVERHLQPLRGLDEDGRDATIWNWWLELLGPRDAIDLDPATRVRELLVLNKLLTGALRVGVSRGLVVRALAELAALPPQVLQHRLMGDWQPSADWFRALLDPDTRAADRSRPYPFFLASPLPDPEPADSLGAPGDWLAEWKWDGIRAQVVRRGGELHIWSRGEELVTDRFPELHPPLFELPDGCVLDGEILAWRDGEPLPFTLLQRRIGRKHIGPKLLADAPVALVAYDLLERDGDDLRERPLWSRRDALGQLLGRSTPPTGTDRLGVSPTVPFGDWPELGALRGTARDRRTEGLMIKRLDSPYRTGRTRGDWWKWKVDPLTVDAVMIYAQAGHGRRAGLHTDYTFAVWQDDQLVPIAKAYSGLDDAEISTLDRWIRRNTIERFGPVRSVAPEQVFELHFEGIQRSPRHKSGVALRFPRIARWRRDKPAAEADRLTTLQALLPG